MCTPQGGIPPPPRGGTPTVCRPSRRGGELFGWGDTTADDVERRSEFCLRPHRVPSEDTDWYTLTLKRVRNEKARTSRTADYEDELVGTHTLASGLTRIRLTSINHLALHPSQPNLWF